MLSLILNMGWKQNWKQQKAKNQRNDGESIT